MAASLDRLDITILARFVYDSRDIKNFKTMVVMDRVKAGFSLPLAIDP